MRNFFAFPRSKSGIFDLTLGKIEHFETASSFRFCQQEIKHGLA